jgi:hypothetical protein
MFSESIERAGPLITVRLQVRVLPDPTKQISIAFSVAQVFLGFQELGRRRRRVPLPSRSLWHPIARRDPDNHFVSSSFVVLCLDDQPFQHSQCLQWRETADLVEPHLERNHRFLEEA